ncbi:amidohydrolase family protein [Microbacterium sp. NPDC055903]
MRVLDSHLHLWDPAVLDYEWLEGPLAYTFAGLELDNARIERTDQESAVFVQADCVEAQYFDEVRWIDGLAEEVGISAIVAGARLNRGEETLAQLDALTAFGRVAGVRHLLQGEPVGLAVSPAFLDGARALAERGLSFDACVRGAGQLADIDALARAVPDLRIVLDHVGKPAVGTASAPLAPTAEWVAGIDALAQRPEVYCKLSGIPAEAGGDWSTEQMIPFLDAAAAAFGVDRLMWGSDWPVSVIGPAEQDDPHAPADGSPTYQYSGRSRWADAVADWAGSRGHDVEAIMWDNAARFYGIG